MTTAEQQIDHQKIEAFAEGVLSDINSSMTTFTMYIGHRLGLYQTLAEAGPITSGKLAQRTGYVERYVREWLFAQAAGGYLDYNAATQRFSLSPEYAAVLVDRDSPAYLMPFTQFGPSITSALPALLEAFRRGGGVPFESNGQDCIEAIAFGNRPMYINDLSDKWIPALPDVAARLRRGGRVADIGCGAGWSSIYIAKGYPHCQRLSSCLCGWRRCR
jgi:hypothetical protein